MVVKFETRFEAQSALQKATNFKDKELSISWYQPDQKESSSESEEKVQIPSLNSHSQTQKQESGATVVEEFYRDTDSSSSSWES